MPRKKSSQNDGETTTIKAYRGDARKLCAIAGQLSQILKRPVSIKKALSVVLSVKSLDVQLGELLNEGAKF